MGDVRRPLPRPRCRGGGNSTGMAGRSNHAAAQSRLTEHGARRCQQQAGCVGAPRRASTERGARVARSGRPSRLARRYPRPRVGVWAITQYRKMQREGLRDSEWPNIYFGSKHKLYKKCTTGSSARAGSEARPGSERRRPVAGRWPVPSTGQNTVLPAHSGLRPPFKKGGDSLQLYNCDCSGTTSHVTPQGSHR